MHLDTKAGRTDPFGNSAVLNIMHLGQDWQHSPKYLYCSK